MKTQKSGKSFAWIKSASDVVARLYSGNMSASDAEQIEDWLDADEANRDEYERCLNAWDAMENLSHRPEMRKIVRRQQSRSSWTGISRKAGVVLAASILVAVFAGFFTDAPLLDRIGYFPETIHETRIGERRSITLSDGSEVTLNTNSRVRVRFRSDRRDVTLEYGEAFFDIRKDVNRPLYLQAGSRQVKVLGTKFNVHWSGPDVTIAVVEGLVAVRPSSQTINGEADTSDLGAQSDAEIVAKSEVLLESGSIAVFSEELGSIDKNYAARLDDLQSWRFGFIRFDKDPLYEVIGELNRYSTTKISIDDKRIMDMPISGIFSLDDVDKILTGLEAVNPIEITRHFDGTTIVGTQALRRE